MGTAIGQPNRKLSEINAINSVCTLQARCAEFAKDVVVNFGGTSDGEFDVGITAADIYSRCQTWEVAHRIFPTVITVGPCAIGSASYPNGYTTAEVTQLMEDWNTLMRAEYSIARTDIGPYIYQNSSGSWYIDLLENPKTNDYNDLTYFNADKGHLNEAGSRVVADEGIVLICNA